MTARRIQITRSGKNQFLAQPVFTGISCQLCRLYQEAIRLPADLSHQVLVIHHCLSGRLELTGKRSAGQLLPGQTLVVAGPPGIKAVCAFPLREYAGITVSCDLEKVPDNLSWFLEGINVSVSSLVKRWGSRSDWQLVEQDSVLSRIFRDLDQAMQNQQPGLMKLKALELLLDLEQRPVSETTYQSGRLSSLQEELAREAAAYLAANVSRSVPVQELADQFHVSVTHLQNAFRGMYGMPAATYARMLRMQSAALRLAHTDRPVLDIACEFGYSNAGKFASAFAKVMGCTPQAYRQQERAQVQVNNRTDVLDHESGV